MKQFCFLNEDDLENLPADSKLIPLDVAYFDVLLNETPKISTTKKSPPAQPPSTPARPGLRNQIGID